MTKEYKFIRISPETHKELEELGTMRDSFEDVIKRLIKFYKENKKN
jgi:predicted CopG family antitoxin